MVEGSDAGVSYPSTSYAGSPPHALSLAGRNCYASGMTKTALFLAAAAFFAAPLAARPMTATDLQSMHRRGAPDISRDGRTAVFTVSTTDWDKNKRVTTLST